MKDRRTSYIGEVAVGVNVDGGGRWLFGYSSGTVSDRNDLQITLLNKPLLQRGPEEGVPGNLLIRLAVAFPNPVDRDRLLLDLYPEVPTSGARNRLRVALTRLRRTVPLVENGEEIGLHLDRVTVDLESLRGKIRQTRLEPEIDDELRGLKALLPDLELALFPGATSTWELEAQSAWSRTAGEALDRLGSLAELVVDSGLAARAAAANLVHFPNDWATWDRYLRSMHRTGRGAEAIRTLSAARRRAKADGVPFPAGLEAWEEGGEPDDRDRLGPELEPGERLALERFVRRAIIEEPALMIELLGSRSFRAEVVRSPKAVLPLLREALGTPGPETEARERIRVRVITALGMLDQDLEVLAAVDEFLSRPVAPARRRIALLAASFAHAMQGDFESALRTIDQAMQLAAGPTAEYDAAECRAQRATFLMLRGDLVEAEAELRASLGFLEAARLEGTEPDLLSIRGNLGICLVLQGRDEEAIEELRPVVDSCRRLGLLTLVAINAPPLALALTRVGQDSGELLTDGLRAAFRAGSRRAVSASAFAATVLWLRGRDPERSLLAESWAFRRAESVPPNAMEIALFGSVLELSRSPERPLVDFIRALMRLCGT